MSLRRFGDFNTGAQYPDPSKDGIEHFCRKCSPAAERMFVELAQQRSEASRFFARMDRYVRLLTLGVPGAMAWDLSEPEPRRG